MERSVEGVASVERSLKYALGLLGLRSSDTLLAAFPKSGSTWVRFVFCNLISLRFWDGKLVTWDILDETMPELGHSKLLARWPWSPVPRVVKTHRPYWPLFRRPSAILLIRDPRDVMLSFYRYRSAHRTAPFRGSLAEFIRTPGLGLEAWFRHYRSWRGRVRACFRYEDLRSRPEQEFGRMLSTVELEVDPGMLAEALRRSDIRSIRRLEDEHGHSRSEVLKEGFRFTGKGATGGWQDELTDEDSALFDELRIESGLEAYG